jgi:malyl-CoA/(S)-citramalyl-CoA lyase
MTSLNLYSYPMMKVLIAARTFGLRAVDGPYHAFRDIDGTRASALMAASMGFDGKQVIHTSQIDATTSAFFSSANDIVCAKRVIDAALTAERQGHGESRDAASSIRQTYAWPNASCFLHRLIRLPLAYRRANYW